MCVVEELHLEESRILVILQPVGFLVCYDYVMIVIKEPL